MVFDTEVVGFIIALSVPISALTGTRLHKTGETVRVGKQFPLSIIVLVLGILQGVTFTAAIFYFSWAHLTWIQNLSALLMFFTLADWIAKRDNRQIIWIAFAVATLASFLAETFLVLS